jgi:hypothetical protein
MASLTSAFWPMIFGGETVTASWADAVSKSMGKSTAAQRILLRVFINAID